MQYIAIVHKDEGSAYGVTLPDFPGCFSAADSIEDLAQNVQEAVEVYAEDEEGFQPPVPKSFDEVAKQANGGVLMLVDVSFDFLDKAVVPVNVSMPAYMRERIDRAAKRRGLTRSAYLVRAAQAFN